MIAPLLFLILAATEPGSRYDDCVALLEAEPEMGRIAAQQWAHEGGGAEAQHCLAIADSQAGFFKLAALRLEETASRNDAGDDYVRARLLSQAAQTWLSAQEPELALKAYEQAYALTPDSGELQLTAASVYAATERWVLVVGAIDTAEKAGFVSAEGFVQRGRAKYVLGDYRSAADDVVNALNLDQYSVEALVLRGDLQQTGIVIEVFYDTKTSDTP